MPIEIAGVLQALLWQLAGSRTCVAREAVVVCPDAYLSQDIAEHDDNALGRLVMRLHQEREERQDG